MSFPPSGSHRIDLSAWDESAEQSDLEDDIREHYEDEPLPMAGSPHPRDEEIGMGRVAVSRERTVSRPPLLIDLTHEPSHEEHATSSPVDESHPSPASPRSGPHSRRQTDSALLSSQYGAPPTLSRIQPPHPLQQNSPTRTRHRASFAATHHASLGPLSPRQGFPHTLSPGAPSGFSIGLSPVSPGFSLVPTERMGRRRRVTSLGSVDDVADAFSSAQHGKPGRRITSEGSRTSLARSSEGERGSGDVEAQAQQQQQPPGSAQEHGSDASRTARGRWKWLGGIGAFRKR